MKKRIFTLLPTLILCLVLLPATAAAAGEHGDHEDWTALTESTTTLSDGGKYYMSEDVTCSGGDHTPITVTGTVTLCLNGHVLDLNGKDIQVNSGAKFTLCDCTDVITYGNIGSDGRWEKADASGTCNLTGGVITGGYNNMGGGGGVKVASGGTFTMTGGNIAGNRAGLGGGVCVDGGTFTMTDGSITGNSAGQSGGGVYVDSGTFTMEGGTINHNSAGSYAGGVYVKGGTFTMEDGFITDNTTNFNGGGVYVYSGTFTMEGGSISHNTASNGGGVFVYSDGTFTMKGGSIHHNSAPHNTGGGVYVYGTFTMENGSITDNTAYSGGGVYVAYGAQFTMEGGSITDNTANRGGGVYAGATFTMRGGSITGNTANKGGGVYVAYGTFTLSGSPAIQGNTLTDPATPSNVYLETDYSITIGKGGLANAKSIGVSMATPGTFTSGWSTYMSGKKPAGYFTSEQAGCGVTLDADGEAKLAPQYTVTFNSNGGSTVDIQTVVEGGTAICPTPAPTKEGYSFRGWYLNEEPYNFETSVVTGDLTLTAKWEANQYTVVFDGNGGNGEMASQTFTYDAPQDLTVNAFTRTGHTFAGWSTEPTGSVAYGNSQSVSNLTAENNGTVTLYAQWDINTYTVTFDSVGGSAVDSQMVKYQDKATKPTDPAKDGFLFLGWYTDEACTQYYDFTAPVTEDLILYAGWVFMPPFSGYSISVPAADHGTVTVSPTTTAASGATVTVTAAPDEGYELASLTVTTAAGVQQTLTPLGSGKFTFTMPAASVTVTAVFQAKTTAAPTEPTAPAGWVNPYTDVAVSDWFYNAVGYASANGLMSGTSATTFSPNSPMSRCMVWTVIARLAGQDISGASWAADAKAWAMAAGVSDGANPDGAISREEIVTMLYRYAGSPAVSTSELGLLGQYPDGGGVSDWARSAMAWAVSVGVIEGRDGQLAAGASLTRAEAAAILGRVHLMRK